MVREKTVFECELCGVTYSAKEDAQRCEARGEEKGNFCYDLHTGLILCSHAKTCMHLRGYGHIGKRICSDFGPRRKGVPPEYYKNKRGLK